MRIDATILIIIAGCTLVTVIPRIMPFLVIRNLNLPVPVLKWLSYVPVCILTALVVQGCLKQTNGSLAPDWYNIAAIVPTLLVAIKTRSLTLTVVSGVVMMAALRFFL
ncbi:branched-chain amino acid transporter AzlD [Paenibacillus sp. CAA11]|uniref:AzlD domain-containing protein n=1 Tax=Paenibacillus sp. CAA11 TaxID=1532905 RepID=UPI000D3C4F0F|nr:AzlD domain-containing protein [Paenibacillus sp. CAA11]AWB44998.1 branched-chain amino acid transporter AzlD [Paenibacillus sp. CAA11]